MNKFSLVREMRLCLKLNLIMVIAFLVSIMYAGNYEVGRLIRCGTFSQVREGVHCCTGVQVALKMANCQSEEEARLWSKVIHPYIVEIFEYIEIDEKSIISMELVQGKELYHIVESGPINEHSAKKIFLQLCLAISECHRVGIAHRDIKLENILINKKGDVKLCDFGLAAEINEDHLMQDYCGSTHYAAPEVLQCVVYDGFLSDTWSLGIVLYTILTGYLPFSVDDSGCGSQEDNDRAVKIKVMEGIYKIPEKMSGLAVDLIQSLLCPAQRRIEVNQILMHPWLIHNKAFEIQPYKEEEVLIEELIRLGFDAKRVRGDRVTPGPLQGILKTLAHKKNHPV